MGGFESISVDQVRSYWNNRPCNIRHSPAEVGSRRYFDEVETRKYFVEPHIRQLAQFERWKGKSVLEIGCGIGTDTVQFARAGASVTAVDLSEQSLDITRRRLDLYGLDATMYQANAEELSSAVPVRNFDLVYSFGVIHHTPHPDRAIAELRRYMGPDSELRMMLYHRWSWKAFALFLHHGRGNLRKFDETVARQSEAQTGCPVTYTYSRMSVKQLLSDFTITDLWIDHIFPYRIEEYVRHEYRKLWYFRLMPQPMFRWLERHIGWHLCLTARKLDGERGGS